MAIQNSLQKSKGNQRLGITAYLTGDAVKNQINQVVGGKNGQRFISAIVSAVNTNPTLQECTNQSILSAALLGESLNLSNSPSLGQFWIIPFNNKKKGVKEAQFQLGANGFKQLAMRTGQYKDIDFLEIHEGEYKGRDKYTGKQVFEFIEDDDKRETLPVIGYMAYFELLNGFRKSVYWTKTKMEKHADKYSQAFSLDAYRKLQEGKIPQSDLWKYSSYWYSNFAGMAEKTLIKHLLSKWGILSTELITAIDADMAVINEDGSKDYVDNDDSIIDAEPPQSAEPQPEPRQEAEKKPETTQQPTDAQMALFGNK